MERERYDSTGAGYSLKFENFPLRNGQMAFTEMPTTNQNLSFETFSTCFHKRVGIPVSNPDTWITLGLSTVEGGFTNAGEILSDQNSFPGIDIVLYGQTPKIIKKRILLAKMSVLDQIEKCVSLFIEQYTYEIPSVLYLEVKELIPVESFRAAITGATAQRDWQAQSTIKVDFYPDKVVVTYPGGLPDGMNMEEYLSDRYLSILKNRSLLLAFLSLGFIDSLGSGISKIMESYSSSLAKPDFQISENLISISLPVLNNGTGLTEKQLQVYQFIKSKGPVSQNEIRKEKEVAKSSLQRILNYLVEINAIKKTGKGPGVRYEI